MNVTIEPGRAGIRRCARATVLVALLGGATTFFAGVPVPSSAGPPPSAATEAGPSRPSPRDLAVALGLLLDMPVSPEVQAEAVRVAEDLRRYYRIDTGHPEADRQEAAERAMTQVIEPLRFSSEELQAAAAARGFSLAPGACANFCENVRRLAEADLRKDALRRFLASGGGTAGTGPSPRP